MSSRRRLLLGTLLGYSGLGQAAGKAFRDPLDAAALMLQQPQAASLLALAAAGKRLVGVGLRGVIIISEDGGASWRQVQVPVQSDLTAAHFPSPNLGWAVGHDGVILHSDDGGLSWRRQFDGRQAAELFKADYAKRAAAGEVSEADLNQVTLNSQAGPALPYLDVWFEDDRRGWVVGSFGTIVATTDGGRNWQAYLHRVDNPGYLNLNAIGGCDGEVYIAGEQGHVFLLDRGSQRFTRLSTGYKGSFFGVCGGPGTTLSFGMRGTVYRSGDRGTSWAAVPPVVPVAVTTGAVLDHNRILLGNVAGMFLLSDDAGRSFRALPVKATPGLTDLLVFGKDRLITCGLQGVNIIALPGAKA